MVCLRDLVLQALPEDEKLCKLIAHVTQDQLEIPVPAREAVSNQLQQDIIPRTLGEHFDWNWIQNDTYRDDIQTQLRNREITLFDCEIEIVTSAGKHFLAVLLPVANNERLFFPLELNDGTSYAVLNGMANTKRRLHSFDI